MVFTVLVILVLGAIIVGPSLWTQSILKKYAAPRPDFPGTGGELARHLLDRLNLQTVATEETREGDHYDIDAKTVRLSPAHYNEKSLAAVVVAAHEVGHALQDKEDYGPLRAGARLRKSTAWLQRVGPVLIMLAPLVAALMRTPSAVLMSLAAGAAIMGVGVVVRLLNLPTEFDASFNRALPMLEQGGYLSEEDLPAARRILTACALTYVASALMQMVNIARWLRVVRF